MLGFSESVLQAAATEREVEFTTEGRQTGRPHRVTIWIATDGQRLFIRSGGGLGRDWPQNLLATGCGVLHLGGQDVPVLARHITDVIFARDVTRLVSQKYGSAVTLPPPGDPPTAAERATFELLPAVSDGKYGK